MSSCCILGEGSSCLTPVHQHQAQASHTPRMSTATSSWFCLHLLWHLVAFISHARDQLAPRPHLIARTPCFTQQLAQSPTLHPQTSWPRDCVDVPCFCNLLTPTRIVNTPEWPAIDAGYGASHKPAEQLPAAPLEQQQQQPNLEELQQLKEHIAAQIQALQGQRQQQPDPNLQQPDPNLQKEPQQQPDKPGEFQHQQQEAAVAQVQQEQAQEQVQEPVLQQQEQQREQGQAQQQELQEQHTQQERQGACEEREEELQLRDQQQEEQSDQQQDKQWEQQQEKEWDQRQVQQQEQQPGQQQQQEQLHNQRSVPQPAPPNDHNTVYEMLSLLPRLTGPDLKTWRSLAGPAEQARLAAAALRGAGRNGTSLQLPSVLAMGGPGVPPMEQVLQEVRVWAWAPGSAGRRGGEVAVGGVFGGG